MNDDLVSRQAVIDYLESISNMDPKERGAIIFSVELLPSVQPKTGRWINIRPLLTAARCSECKSAFADKTNFCPHCGAKMEGGEEHG